jgi:SH3-like domain-containing protein
MAARSIHPLLSGTLVAGLLVALPGPGPGAPEAIGSSGHFVRIKVDRANLRTGPSLDADVARYAYENEPLRVLAQRGDWLQVRDFEGEAGWIYRSLTDRRPAFIVTRDLVNVRAEPGTDQPVVFTAERTVGLLVLDHQGSWLHVRHDVGQGWVHEDVVWGDP